MSLLSPDGISPTLLQHAGDTLHEYLVEVYKDCLRWCNIPDGSKYVLVVFILKTGKPSHIGPKYYRPISLSFFLLKSLCGLVDLYLRSNVDWSLLSRSQHASNKGKSDKSAFYDAAGFDEANLARGENSLRNIHAPDFLVRFSTHMRYNRLIRSNLGGCSIVSCATGETPQGVLSLQLWFLVINFG